MPAGTEHLLLPVKTSGDGVEEDERSIGDTAEAGREAGAFGGVLSRGVSSVGESGEDLRTAESGDSEGD